MLKGGVPKAAVYTPLSTVEVEEKDGGREEGDGGERGKERRKKERYDQEDTGNWYFISKKRVF